MSLSCSCSMTDERLGSAVERNSHLIRELPSRGIRFSAAHVIPDVEAICDQVALIQKWPHDRLRADRAVLGSRACSNRSRFYRASGSRLSAVKRGLFAPSKAA